MTIYFNTKNYMCARILESMRKGIFKRASLNCFYLTDYRLNIGFKKSVNKSPTYASNWKQALHQSNTLKLLSKRERITDSHLKAIQKPLFKYVEVTPWIKTTLNPHSANLFIVFNLTHLYSQINFATHSALHFNPTLQTFIQLQINVFFVFLRNNLR